MVHVMYCKVLKLYFHVNGYLYGGTCLFCQSEKSNWRRDIWSRKIFSVPVMVEAMTFLRAGRTANLHTHE